MAALQAHYGGGYACDYPGCTSVFKENAKLKRHKLVHTGEKAFKCDYCGLSFSLRHNLKTHEKTHTRIELETKAIRRFAKASIVSYSCPSLMIIASASQFHVFLPWGQRPFSIVS